MTEGEVSVSLWLLGLMSVCLGTGLDFSRVHRDWDDSFIGHFMQKVPR